MRKINHVFFFSLIFLSTAIFSLETTYKCKSGWFSSINLVVNNGVYFLDGVKYPNYTEEINSVGYLWADVMEANETKNELLLTHTTKHAKGTYIEKVEFFDLNLRNLGYEKGVKKYRRTSIGEKIADWFDSASGTCSLI